MNKLDTKTKSIGYKTGIYILFIKVKKQTRIKIGALGLTEFKKGTYAYIGSAQNNLEKRVQRHKSKSKKLHWHIDYLLKNKNTRIIKVLTKQAKKEEECRTAKKLSKQGIGIKGFGCSDCACYSHLIMVKEKI